MSSGNDDDLFNDPRDGERYDEGEQGDLVERARQKVATPAMLLIVASLIALLLQLVSIGLIVARPTIVYDTFVKFIENQPPGPERQKALDDFKKQEADMRLDTPQTIVSAVVGVIVNILSLVGGMKMRSLSGYGISMTGAIAGIIPCGGCCCLTLPVGIWALVVLLNPDVKAGFAAAARGRTRDGY